MEGSPKQSKAPRERREITPAQAGAVLAATFFVLDLLTRTRDFGGDGTVFAMAIDAFLRDTKPGALFLHPHHVLYNPLVAAAAAVGRLFVPGLWTLDAGAAVSAAAGALTVGLLATLLMRRGLPAGTALLAAATVGLSGGFWGFSARLEVYTLAALAVVLWLAVLSRPDPAPAAAGSTLGLAMLAHLAMGVLVPATAAGVRPPWRRRLTAIGFGLAIPALVLGTALLLRGPHGSSAAHALLPSSYDAYLRTPDPGAVPRALGGLLWWGWYHTVPVLRPEAASLFDQLAVAARLLAVVLLLSGLVACWRRRGPRIAAIALAALAGFTVLWLVWDVGNVEHTVASAPLWGVLLATGAAALPRRTGPLLLALLAALLLIGNGLGSAIPQSRPENGRVLVLADFVRRTVPEDGTVLSLGADARLRLGLGYLSGRRVVSLALAVDSARSQGRSPEVALVYWLDRGRTATTVWLTPDVLGPRGAAFAEQELGIPAAELSKALAHLVPEDRTTLPPDGVTIQSPFTLTRATVR